MIEVQSSYQRYSASKVCLSCVHATFLAVRPGRPLILICLRRAAASDMFAMNCCRQRMSCVSLIRSRNEDSVRPLIPWALKAQPLVISRAPPRIYQGNSVLRNCELIAIRKIPHNCNETVSSQDERNSRIHQGRVEEIFVHTDYAALLMQGVVDRWCRAINMWATPPLALNKNIDPGV
jgi:hypothetical protein